MTDASPPRPVLLAVDDDPHVLRAVRRDLRAAYADRYRVLSAPSGREALRTLDSLEARDEEPALFLVDQRMPDMTGVDFLLEAVARFPSARRVLLTAYADTEAAITAINQVRLDHYLLKPWDPPEERLYPVLDDLLDDWWASYHPPYRGIRVVGHPVSPAAHHIRDFLTRNQQPFRFVDAARDEEAAQLTAGHPDARLPLVLFPEGDALSAPDSAQLAGRLGIAGTATRPHYDVLIVGGGPAGLGGAVYSASEGLSTLLLDRDVPGGQAGMSSRIENYLGFPTGLSGGDLARRAVTQARRFGAEILSPVEAVGLRKAGPSHIVTLADGREISAEVVLLTTGVSYNRLDVPGVERFENAGLYYGAATAETTACAGEEVHIIGGANSAGQAAMHFSQHAADVTLLVRGDSLEKGMSQYLVDEIAARPNIRVRLNTRVTGLAGGDRLEELVLRDSAEERTEEVPARFVFTFIGARPRTDWVAGLLQRNRAGFLLTGPDLVRGEDGGVPGWEAGREPFLLETSMPGVFAAGDVRAGSVKRVASGVGEGAMAVALIHRYRASV
ncbi:FAD-dependent oxidoreductase [Actinorugispora endophytica]|uniref:Thioredoxin reductase (NADPH) n=1 Tax=Actinorugispora endophytica TaxID=1605990 RepID=A0A4R6UMT5_9ACTN|nr:FAD-dependent oxidoreductase [Actinorugispora endophytica]TDQ46889.1 thioredoxin reductase (NADPH) [Actinorugispora endophytica]